jgi:hypothetical protein
MGAGGGGLNTTPLKNAGQAGTKGTKGEGRKQKAEGRTSKQ